MSDINRIHAINAIAEYPSPKTERTEMAALERFGENVFNAAAIRRFLPPETAEKLMATVSGDAPFDESIAEEVAGGMKNWAMNLGATHYSHWFQPLHGGTAEKHDAFLEMNSRGEAITAFSGKNLIMGEPDASSLPSGGLRSTFEARGYTAWDPKSFAFIKRHSNGATLCIPTFFCSYTGAVLDKKTPLLRSIQALKRSVVRLMTAFGFPPKPVTVTLGPEQEYFLIDRNFFLHRPDLLQTGRTLFGSTPPKHQQLDDHYFGTIKPRILAFMSEIDEELWKLGIPAKTRHNETAPAQFEVAALFEELNLAVDHNLLLMEVLQQTAIRHNLVCLLHEKPFAGVNGSGKHNNWSVAYDSRNLLDPGDNPDQNAIFLTFLCAMIRAVDLHGDLLRSTVATAGNEHRLGANEAPPAIFSIFLGDRLTDIMTQIGKGTRAKNQSAEPMRIGVDSLPPLPRDATDRNRTSPFAFTGNKFEFRACGSNQSCAGPNTALNTIAAESLDFISEKLENLSSSDFNDGLQKILGSIVRKHKRIIFNGNNYSQEWIEEAQKRGLPNLKTTEEGLSPIIDKKNQALYQRYNVLFPAELDSRHEFFLREYRRKIRIEGEVALEIAKSLITPTLLDEYQRVLEIYKNAQETGVKPGLTTLAALAEELGQKVGELHQASADLEKSLSGPYSEIQKAMERLRSVVDAVEMMTDDSRWPLPKYREMLFIF